MNKQILVDSYLGNPFFFFLSPKLCPSKCPSRFYPHQVSKFWDTNSSKQHAHYRGVEALKGVEGLPQSSWKCPKADKRFLFALDLNNYYVHGSIMCPLTKISYKWAFYVKQLQESFRWNSHFCDKEVLIRCFLLISS